MFGQATRGGGQSDFGLGDSIQRATQPRAAPTQRPSTFPTQANMRGGSPLPGGVPPGLARQGVTSFTPGQGSPFGAAGPAARTAMPSPVAPAPTPTLQAAPQLPQQANPLNAAVQGTQQPPWGNNPMFSFLWE